MNIHQISSLRFKPVPLAMGEADSEVFGKNDMNNEKMAEKRRREHNLFREQQDFVAQKKRDAILKRLSEQKEEEDVLSRNRKGSRYRKRQSPKRVLIVGACLVLIHVFYLSAYSRSTVLKTSSTEEPPKTILWYYPPRYLANDVESLVPLDACPHLRCFMTSNRSVLASSDAVLFSAEHIKDEEPPSRSPGQIWVYHNNEPPYHFAVGRPFHKAPWTSVFNWTMDYRLDADIVRPYAVLRKYNNSSTKNYTEIMGKKRKLVAMMVSNCDNWSGRLKYAHELNKYIPVDIFGACGKMLFTRKKNHKWMAYLNRNFKFFLAFENLYCKDYISEKFFNNYNLDLVTIARGGGNYSRDVPPGTYLNVKDFASPKQLAEHLWFLHNHTEKYVDILKKKDQFYFENEEYFYVDPVNEPYREHYYEKKPLCDLCRRLYNNQNYTKTIPDLMPWFKQGICIKRDFEGSD